MYRMTSWRTALPTCYKREEGEGAQARGAARHRRQPGACGQAGGGVGFGRRRLVPGDGPNPYRAAVTPTLSTLPTSNMPVNNWDEFFMGDTETLMCTLDRIFDKASVFMMRGPSFRGADCERFSVEAVPSVARVKQWRRGAGVPGRRYRRIGALRLSPRRFPPDAHWRISSDCLCCLWLKSPDANTGFKTCLLNSPRGTACRVRTMGTSGTSPGRRAPVLAGFRGSGGEVRRRAI